MKKIRTYSELVRLKTFQERFQYLQLGGAVGKETFGYDRFLNQRFYMSKEWKDVRDYVIIRDNGCDLGLDGYDIFGKIIIHHMNPVVLEDLTHGSGKILDPEYLITVCHNTHNAIHYGDGDLLVREPVVRKKNDTCPWKN